MPDGDAYSQALVLNGSEFAAGRSEAAYHFLMAALHCAESAGDAGRLADVAALARRQREALDAHSPPHRLATQSAHGGRSVFEMAAHTAEAVLGRLDNERRLAALRRPQ